MDLLIRLPIQTYLSSIDLNFATTRRFILTLTHDARIPISEAMFCGDASRFEEI